MIPPFFFSLHLFPRVFFFVFFLIVTFGFFFKSQKEQPNLKKKQPIGARLEKGERKREEEIFCFFKPFFCFVSF